MSFRTDGALEAETAPLPHLTVCASEHFVSDVEEVLGKGALSLLS
jgi:DNA polymerase-3 subunit alpha